MSKVTIQTDVGLDHYSIEFIHHLEEELDNTMVRNGFSRIGTTKSGDELKFYYHQFAVALDWEKDGE